MDKKYLPRITLLGIDCIDIERLRLAADISTKHIEFGSVKLLSSIKSDDPRVVPIRKIKSVKDYSNFLIKELDTYIDTEFVIIFQYDGFVLNPDAWTDEFLNYDYIGAPWAHLGDTKVGNGGFSLRSKRLTSWLTNNRKRVGARIHPEDIFICKFARPYAEKDGIKFAPPDLAGRFSKEGDEDSVFWDGEFGFHGISYTDISHWLNKHPEYKKKLTYELDDYAILMQKYPTNNGTIHTFRYRKHEKNDYANLARGKRNYEARPIKERYFDWNKIKEGHLVVFKRSGVSFKELPIPAFERRVEKIEKFKSFYELRDKYPKLKVTYPIKNIKKWQRSFVKFFGDWAYPKNIEYGIFWFNK